MNTKKILTMTLGFIGTTFFLWLSLRDVHFNQVKMALSQASWWWVFPMAVVVYLDLVIRAIRWRILLSQAKPHCSIMELTKLEAIGLAINNVLFLRLGEVSRGILASKNLKISAFSALASIVIERALDVISLLTLFSIAVYIAPGFVPPSIRLSCLLVLFGGVVALLILALAESFFAEGGFLNKFLNRWPKIQTLVNQLSLGASVLRNPIAAAQAIFLSLMLWTIDATLYWAGAYALNIQAFIDFPRSVLALSWAGATSILPAAPGAIGTFEAAVAAIVEKFGATAEHAFAYALVCHSVMYILVTLTGLVLLYRVGLSLADIKDRLE